MMRLLSLAVLVGVSLALPNQAQAQTQEPKVDAQGRNVLLDTERVRVTEVRVKPGAKLELKGSPYQFLYMLSDDHALHELLVGDDLLRIQHRANFRLMPRRRPVQDLVQLLPPAVLNAQLIKESIQLCFGKRIGSLLLQRVLRRHHEERLGQRVGMAGHGDRVLLHRFEQGRLRLGRGPVDLIGQEDVGEHGALLELVTVKGSSKQLLAEIAAALSIRWLPDAAPWPAS